MKVAIYLRVSRDDLNLENQRIPLVKRAELEGWEYEVFEEKESTRKTRPVQYDLYRRALKKEFDAIVVFKFDRWARNATELITHMNDFKDKGVLFISHSENIDTQTSYGRAFFGFISVMAEFERDLIRERTMAGLERARAQGKKLGRPRKGREFIKPSRKDVAELMVQDLQLSEMARKLKTSKYWVETVIKEIQTRGGVIGGGFLQEKPQPTQPDV
jgi:DNA invertase Pin-like site-specific DNA recombinase